MTTDFNPSFMPIGIGSLPYHDPHQASKTILDHFPESPYWPQLPSRGWKEGMFAQFTEGMPGLALDGERIYFHTPFNPPSEWEKFHELSQEGNEDHFGIGKEYASGFHTMLELLKGKSPKLIKGQLTGPITLGLGLLDEKRIPILYDPNLTEMLLKILSLRARWQEREFKKVAPEAKTLIFFDEPLLSSYGSISMNLGKEEIIACLKRSISLLQGFSGIHVCGATDWSITMETGIKVIHFDAYRYFPNMLAYASELKNFLMNGGILGWGIVPSEEEYIKVETTSSLIASLEEKIELLIKEGIPEEFLIKNSFLSQSCGLASISEELAEKALKLTGDLSFEMKKRFNSKLFN
jgi:methionine synthase II (cobalamin-independent)